MVMQQDMKSTIDTSSLEELNANIMSYPPNFGKLQSAPTRGW